MDVSQLSAQLGSLVVFRELARGPVLQKLNDFLQTDGLPADRQVTAYADFVAALFREGCDFGAWLLDAAASDENAYVRLLARNEPIPPALAACADAELSILASLSSLTPDELCARIPYSGYLPRFSCAPFDFRAAYARRMADIRRTGWGVFAHHVMFGLRGEEIVPLRSPDPVRVADLVGYAREREQVLANAEALLRGLPAANALLVGDAGTGKSTTVKAVANELAPRGLRLLEMRRDQLRSIPAVMEQLRENPLRFILFIDDLSFSRIDDNFSALKAVLEGSATARSDNVILCATSNRRHLVRESFSDREAGDDVHRQDTMQELLSLSERFGLTISFSRPDKALYLEIVRELARRKGVRLAGEAIDREAEAFALRRGGRTARAAEQFTDSLVAETR